ncbi:hypothetical protein GCM10011492_34600 [Flexivirga endophytica]|uniref:Uncharacterized protein n=1 Tax=Flexivirga endophytica TaxID=1849103 RepID=A0A916TEE4_9MICO|nr:hypothetical protein [Flexivirga endophytica]GGB40856.1 hypothetical protein GCM10011492_34600 [Flexivirga endophytica]GHB48639.1 hypothetical protein GCM10008112_16980 [Flexivirga endophytica]
MTSLARAFRDHRDNVRSRRALMDAIHNASTQSARDDLVMAMQRANTKS